MKTEIPEYVNAILSALNEGGFEAYIVGGGVRDIVLLRTPNDFDITTDAKPDEMKAVFAKMKAFSDVKTVETGLMHGTITVICDGRACEVTTYRIDGEYIDSRHPEAVEFTSSLAEDLRRRDFTINAMAYNDEVGLVDLFGGCDDIKNKLIRCVGDPNKRFSEDALRILRAFRFAARLGFSIEEKTLQAIKNNKEKLSFISRERVFSELSQLLLCENPQKILKTMEKSGVLPYVLYGYNGKEKSFDGISHLPKNIPVRLAFFLQDIVSDYDVAISKLKTSNEIKKKTKKLLEISDEPFLPTERYAREFIVKYGDEADDAVALASALYLLVGETGFSEFYEAVRSEEFPRSIAELKVSGADISAEGRLVGEVLQYLHEKTLGDPSLNEKEILLDMANKYIKEKENDL